MPAKCETRCGRYRDGYGIGAIEIQNHMLARILSTYIRDVRCSAGDLYDISAAESITRWTSY